MYRLGSDRPAAQSFVGAINLDWIPIPKSDRPMRLVSVFSLLVPCAILRAQSPILTPAFNPYPGLSATYSYYSDDLVINGGPGMNWNFGWTSTGAPFTLTWTEPSFSPCAPQFPTATVALWNNTAPEGNAWFYQCDDTGIHLLGYCQPNLGSSTVYSEPEEMVIYPCSNGTTWTDNYAFTTSGGSSAAGQVDWACIGYGTLHLPYATIWDALLLKSVQIEYSDTIDGEVFTDRLDWYLFVSPSHPCNLAFIEDQVSIFGNETYHSYLASVLQSIDTSVPSASPIAHAPRCWPSPTSEFLNIEGADRMTTIQVYTMSGIPIATTMKKQGDVLSFSVQDLPAGSYMLRALKMDMSSFWSTFLVSH